MKTLTAIAAAIFFNYSAQSAELYTDSGEVIEIPEGSKVYISEGQAFEFTRFSAEGFDLRPLVPVTETEEEECDEFTFGGEGC
jgi:hypothetical protein